MYLDGIETVHNRRERNKDCGECSTGLTVFAQTARPIGLITRAGELSREFCDIAHWYLLYNSPELQPYLEYVNHSMSLLSMLSLITILNLITITLF
jgi:hypothetical protein